MCVHLGKAVLLLTTMYNNTVPMQNYRKDGAKLFAVMHDGRTRKNGQKLGEKVLTKHWENFFTRRMLKHWSKFPGQ